MARTAPVDGAGPEPFHDVSARMAPLADPTLMIRGLMAQTKAPLGYQQWSRGRPHHPQRGMEARSETGEEADFRQATYLCLSRWSAVFAPVARDSFIERRRACTSVVGRRARLACAIPTAAIRGRVMPRPGRPVVARAAPLENHTTQQLARDLGLYEPLAADRVQVLQHRPLTEPFRRHRTAPALGLHVVEIRAHARQRIVEHGTPRSQGILAGHADLHRQEAERPALLNSGAAHRLRLRQVRSQLVPHVGHFSTAC
jgi:hypothetical protein